MSGDVMSPSQRRLAMSHNSGRTKPERSLASALWHRGVRYFTYKGYRSVTGRRLSGDPDIVLPRRKTVVFVDGCFWHGCSACHKYEGLSQPFWINKINANKSRDAKVNGELLAAGWTVLRIPEHDVKTKAALSKTVAHLLSQLSPSAPTRSTC